MGLPLGDWQFWVSGVIVLAAALWIGRGLVRGFLPSKRKHQTKVTLTVQGAKRKKK